MAQLTEKPLDLRNKFKVAFGSSGPENVQKLIEHQTSALTLLLTACNCKTLSAQQRYLETSKNRKVLHRAKADSVSLYVHRDSASLTSKMTDNLSKISRVFEFDSNIFSTGVYERAFRGSIRDLLRRRQQNMTAQSSTAQKTESVSTSNGLRKIRILGQDHTGKDLLVNCIEAAHLIDQEQCRLYNSKLQELCIDLVSTIVKDRSDACDDEDVRILTSYAVLEPHSSQTSVRKDALNSCVRIMRKAVELNEEFSSVAFNFPTDRIEFEDMVFWVRCIPGRGLSINSGNLAAEFFIHQMLDSPFPDPPDNTDYFTSSAAYGAEILRAERMTESPLATVPHEGVSFQVAFGARDLVTVIDARSHYHEDETALVFVFDLQDYSVGCPRFEELKGRIERNSLLLAESIVFPQFRVVAIVLRNFGAFKKQVKMFGFPLEGSQPIFNSDVAVEHIKMSLNSQLKARGWRYTFTLNDNKDMDPIETLDRLRELIVGMKRSSVTAGNTSRPGSQIRLSSKTVESTGVAF
ncbi:hypothetical protein AA0116_g3107 [Alternaria tenuissima]|nr:hypothetical protein AA0116_g3107 [Alternaria tenuissima]